MGRQITAPLPCLFSLERKRLRITQNELMLLTCTWMQIRHVDNCMSMVEKDLQHHKAQRMDDDPVPTPKVKASPTEGNINQVAEMDMCHNDESTFPEGFEDDALVPDSEDDLIARTTECSTTVASAHRRLV